MEHEEEKLYEIATVAIVTYDKNNINGYPLIGKIKDLKTKQVQDNSLYVNEKILIIFIEEIKNTIKSTKENGMNPILLFPPTKPNTKNQMKELILNIFKMEILFYELISKDFFSMKDIGGIKERQAWLEVNYQNWEVEHNITENNLKNYYIFVDDVVINGVFPSFCFKALEKNLSTKIANKNKKAILISSAYDGIHPKWLKSTKTNIIIK